MPLGDWATWVQSAATVGALVAAIVAAVVAQKVYNIESERDERTAEERRVRFEAERRGQADKIAAWYAWLPQHHSGNPGIDFRTPFGWSAFVRNASDLPIYDVDVEFYYVVPDAPDGNVPGRRGTIDRIPVLPPQDEVAKIAPSEMLDQVAAEAQDNHAVAIEFRDATGTRWRRDIYGKLTEV